MTHKLTHVLRSNEDSIQDDSAELSGDTSIAVGNVAVPCVVSANGGGANAVSIAITSAGFVSMALLASVPCVVTLTGVTAIDGVTASTVTLAANKLRAITAITGDMTAMSVGANTTGAGPAGTIQIRALFNS